MEAQLIVADLYLEGKIIKRDIKKAIHLYQKVSSFDNKYAKNNLGVIYKNGFDEIDTNIDFAKICFNEAIQLDNDAISMYNLANILYNEEEKSGRNHDEYIKLLVKSSEGFDQSLLFLCLILMKKHNFLDLNIIEKEINKTSELSKKILNTYYDYNLYSLKKEKLEYFFQLCRKSDYVYVDFSIVSFIDLIEDDVNKKMQKQNLKLIDENFYQGFGIDK